MPGYLLNDKDVATLRDVCGRVLGKSVSGNTNRHIDDEPEVGGGGQYSGPFAVVYDGTTVTVKGGVAYIIDQLIAFEDTELTVESFGAVVINFTLNASNVVIGTITTVSNLTASTAAVEQVPLATLVDGVLIQQQYGHIYAGGGRAW